MAGHRLAAPALLVGMVSISFAAILIRWSDSHPLLVGAYRMSLGALLILPWVALFNRDELGRVWREHRTRLRRMALVGVVLGFHFAFFITAVTLTSVAAAVLLATLHPLFVAPLGHWLYGERLGLPALVGIPLAFAGVVALIGGSQGLGIGSFEGNLLALGGGVTAGAYYLAGRRLRRDTGLGVYALVVYSSAALTLWGLSLAATALGEIEPGELAVLDGREWLLFGLMALIPTLGGHTTQNWALRHVPAYGVSVTLLGEPIGAVLLAIPLLGEWPAWVEVAGGAVILAGIGLTLLDRTAERIGPPDKTGPPEPA